MTDIVQQTPYVPSNRLSASSICVCTLLFCTAEQRSTFVKVEAFSSHRFLDNVNMTTGSSSSLRRWPTRWTYKLLSTVWNRPPPPPPRENEGAPRPPPRAAGAPRCPRCGAPARAPSRWTGGSPAASRSLSCLRRSASPASLYLWGDIRFNILL